MLTAPLVCRVIPRLEIPSPRAETTSANRFALTGGRLAGRQLDFTAFLVAHSRTMDLLLLAIDVGAPDLTSGTLVIGFRIGGILRPTEAVDLLFHGRKQPESDRGSQHLVEKFARLGFVALQEGRFQFLM